MKNNLRKNSSRALKLSLLAGAGAAGFAADNASADIVSTNLNEVSDSSGGNVHSIGFSFSNGVIGTDGSAGYIGGFGSSSGKYTWSSQVGGNFSTPPPTGSAEITAAPIALGSLIDGSSAWAARVSLNQGLPDLYYGVRFSLGGGNYNYSWLTISTPGTLLDFGNAGVQTTVNAAIAAGDTGAVPEPSTYALLALAGGAAALAALRRKKAA